MESGLLVAIHNKTLLTEIILRSLSEKENCTLWENTIANIGGIFVGIFA